MWWLETPLSHMFLELSIFFSWNLIFHRNLSDVEIEDLERLMSSLSFVHLIQSIPYKRAWSLSCSSIFSAKSFLLALFNWLDLVYFPLAKFIWQSKASSKVKAFARLVANKKVNTGNLLYVRRPHKARNLDCCTMCMMSGETIDHLFSYCLSTMCFA